MNYPKYYRTETDNGYNYYKVERTPTDRIGTVNDPENGQIEFHIYKYHETKISKEEYDLNKEEYEWRCE
jgi:hypothetical protein